MALTLTVTQISAVQVMTGAFNITMNLTAKDGAVEVINQDFSTIHKNGVPVTRAEAIIRENMQSAINAWKAADVVYDSAVLNNAVSRIQAALVG